jgi:hypothetical protein
MAIDGYAARSDSLTGPARSPFAVVPHDTNELTNIPKALYVGTGGTIILRGVDGSADVTFKNVASGQILDIRVQYVRATGTTAPDIVGLL